MSTSLISWHELSPKWYHRGVHRSVGTGLESDYDTPYIVMYWSQNVCYYRRHILHSYIYSGKIAQTSVPLVGIRAPNQLPESRSDDSTWNPPASQTPQDRPDDALLSPTPSSLRWPGQLTHLQRPLADTVEILGRAPLRQQRGKESRLPRGVLGVDRRPIP